MSGAELTRLLIAELSQQPVNILRVRSLCRSHAGLIASAGLRLKTWTTLLLGLNASQSSGADEEQVLKQDVVDPIEPCGEQHVLEADVHRTRAEIDLFRQLDVREYIRILLQRFCLEHQIQYKQGMNEVIAPLVFLVHVAGGDGKQVQHHQLTYTLFKALLFRYLERFFCVDDSSFLFKSFRMFHLLLLYYDPQLANHLNDNGFSPEFYCPQWFLTLYARALPLPQVLRLWDMMIAVDDPSFTFFIGLCMLRRQRFALLMGDHANIPDIIAKLSFKNEDEIDTVVEEAIKLYKTVPRCILRQLRLCCVSTTELTPLPVLSSLISSVGKSFTSQLQSIRLNVEEHDEQLMMQTLRKAMMITPVELVDGLLSSNKSSAMNSGSAGDEVDSSSMHIPQQYMIIDIRSYEDKKNSGGGMLPVATELDPQFLNSPDAFDAWVQHFDGMRGCNICIIDMPPVQWTGMALWRRLLLGEGDASSFGDFRARYDFDNPVESRRRLDALLANKRSNTTSDANNVQHEVDLLNADLQRPAMLLAVALQAHSFPNISVLEGGFPSLVEHLFTSRGTVEPVIINHEEKKWEQYLLSTGRSAESLQSTKGKKSKNAVKDMSTAPTEEPIPYARDMTLQQQLTVALGVAERLGHTVTHRIIKSKLETMNTAETI